MMKVLSIGNSFSQDAHRYLHLLAGREGVAMKTVNLFIGGCSLRTHYLNMLGDHAAYDFEFNGQGTGIKVSLRQALESDDWDCITWQQASHLSGHFETYTPYIEALAEYGKKYCPHAKILIHQTWAYEDGSEKLKALGDYATAGEMLAAVCAAYEKAAESIRADGVIPSGRAMMKALEMGLEKVHRDTFHASLGVGRYLLALCWYKALTGRDISHNDFHEFDAAVTEAERRIAIKAVDFVWGDALIGV